MAFTALIVREDPGVVREQIERMVAAKLGIAYSLDRSGLLTTVGGVPARGGNAGDEWQFPSRGAGVIRSDSLMLRIEPAPDRGVEFSAVAEGQEEPIIYSPLSASYSRRSGTRNASIEFVLDGVLTPQAMGVSDWSPPDNWISQYATTLEALLAPIPVIDRKPWVAIKHGPVVHGAGRFGFQVESVDYVDEWYGAKGVDRMTFRLRLREYLVV